MSVDEESKFESAAFSGGLALIPNVVGRKSGLGDNIKHSKSY